MMTGERAGRIFRDRKKGCTDRENWAPTHGNAQNSTSQMENFERRQQKKSPRPASQTTDLLKEEVKTIEEAETQRGGKKSLS